MIYQKTYDFSKMHFSVNQTDDLQSCNKKYCIFMSKSTSRLVHPMLLIEHGVSKNKSCPNELKFTIYDFMNPHKISANSDNEQKSFVPIKKFWHVSIRDFKKSKILFSE